MPTGSLVKSTGGLSITHPTTTCITVGDRCETVDVIRVRRMVKLGMDDNMSTNSNDIGTDNLVDGMRNGNGGEDKVPKVQYTIPGVLHYVQHEWAKFEMERSQWEVERAELQARIAFLQGERKGQENLKNDLVRRIKMLEYALKQERLKNHRLLHGSSADVDLTDQAVTDETNSVMQLPSDTDAITTQPNSNTYWREGRQLLRKYLEEIGFTDTILDVRSYRVRSLLGLKSDGSESNINGRQLLRDSSGNIIEARQLRDVVTSEHPVLSSMNFGGNVNNQILANKTPSSKLIADHDSDNEEDITTAVNKPARKSSTKQDYCAEEEEALAEFQFLTCNDALRLTSATNASKKELHPSSGEEWGVDYSALNKKKEMYQKEAMTKKGASHSRLPRAELQAMITALNEDQQSPISKQQSGGQQQNFDNKTPPANTTTTTINPLNAAVNRNALYYPGSEVKSSTDRLTLGELSALSGVDEADPVTHSVNHGTAKGVRKKLPLIYSHHNLT
uniref:Striatin N-terminal domain-containing protein n=1 Tax=Romanomermis culicivorax TaxID=13658 RepID=A0A915K328_ROMCU